MTIEGRALEAAVEIAEAAGPIALRYFRTALAVDDKSTTAAGFDPVTAADREIEAFIRGELERRFPEHGIVGEEGGVRETDSPYRWLIDPIDGTRAFLSGMPAWGILLGLVRDDVPLAGVMHQPYLGETFFGKAAGTTLRRADGDRPLRTRDRTTLAEATVFCTHPRVFGTAEEYQAFERVASACRLAGFGGDCYSYCLLAMGQIDLVIESSLKPYDIIPLMPIVAGAGGVVTDRAGAPPLGGGFVVAAANTALHAQALAALRPPA